MLKDAFLELAKEMELEVQTVVGEGDVENFVFNISGSKSIYMGNAVCLEEEELFVCTVNMSLKVPEEKMAECSVYILNRSYDYIFTGIYIDPESHIVVSRCPMRISGSHEMCIELIKAAIYQAAAVADEEYEGIVKVILGD